MSNPRDMIFIKQDFLFDIQFVFITEHDQIPSLTLFLS